MPKIDKHDVEALRDEMEKSYIEAERQRSKSHGDEAYYEGRFSGIAHSLYTLGLIDRAEHDKLHERLRALYSYTASTPVAGGAL